MKRVKIMLTAITVLAVVGGALAFKAQKFSMAKICSGSGPLATQCQNWAENITTTNDPLPNQLSFYYTEVTGSNCSGVSGCPTQTYLKGE